MEQPSTAVEAGKDRGGTPAPSSAVAQARPRPAMSRDSAFFWEGAALGELRVQRCRSCGKLRHPPGPSCPGCRSLDWDYLVTAGRGRVYSYVVHHHPPLPAFEVPFVVAVVELEEGVRVVGDLLGVDRTKVEIGMPVVVRFQQVDEDLVLPQWVEAEEGSP